MEGYHLINETICSEYHGDGVRIGTEECDDGNLIDVDGCTANGTVEIGWTCIGSQPDVCLEVCGDGRSFHSPIGGRN